MKIVLVLLLLFCASTMVATRASLRIPIVNAFSLAQGIDVIVSLEVEPMGDPVPPGGLPH